MRHWVGPDSTLVIVQSNLALTVSYPNLVYRAVQVLCNAMGVGGIRVST